MIGGISDLVLHPNTTALSPRTEENPLSTRSDHFRNRLVRISNVVSARTHAIRASVQHTFDSLRNHLNYVRTNTHREMEVQNDDNKLATSRLSPLSTPSDTPRVSRFAAPCISPINTPISTPPDTPLMTRQTSLPTTTVTPLQQLLNTVEEDSHKMVLQDLRELLGVLGHTDIKTSVLAQFENINWSGSRSEMEEIVKAVQTCGRQHLHGYDLAMFNHMIGTQQQIRDMYVARSNQLRDNITQLNNDIGQYATRLVETRHYH